MAANVNSTFVSYQCPPDQSSHTQSLPYFANNNVVLLATSSPWLLALKDASRPWAIQCPRLSGEWLGSPRPPSSDKRRPAACCRVRRRLQPAPLVKAGCYVPPCHLFSLQDPVSWGPPPPLCGGGNLLHGVSLNGGRQTGVRWVLGRSCFSGPLGNQGLTRCWPTGRALSSGCTDWGLVKVCGAGRVAHIHIGAALEPLERQ